MKNCNDTLWIFLWFSFVYVDSFDISEQVTLLTRLACDHKHVTWRSAGRRYGYVWLVGASDCVLVCSLGSVLLVTLTSPFTSWSWAPHHVVCHSYIPVPSGTVGTAVMWCPVLWGNPRHPYACSATDTSSIWIISGSPLGRVASGPIVGLVRMSQNGIAPTVPLARGQRYNCGRSNHSLRILADIVRIILAIGGTAVAQWLRCSATNRKVAGSIPTSVSGFFINIKSFRSHYGPGVDSAFNRNEYQEYFLGGKGGRCVRLTNLPPSCAVVMKSGNLNFLVPSGPLQACNGTDLSFL